MSKIDLRVAWLEGLDISGKGKLAKTVGYALNEKKYLYTFLENGDVPVDNNRAENAIRPFTIGEKTGFSIIQKRVQNAVRFYTR